MAGSTTRVTRGLPTRFGHRYMQGQRLLPLGLTVRNGPGTAFCLKALDGSLQADPAIDSQLSVV